ncbi:MAG TPA: ATP-binding protein [Thermoanaerobaculia bacterium]|nr:ATP-binding protein [Thermoanaerobaculia bacterium]
MPLRSVRTFGQKLSLAVMLSSGAAVATVALLLAIANHRDVRREAVDAAETQARVVALNSGAALVFGDRVFGRDTLAALRAVPDVAAAALFDADGETFAGYQRQREPGPLPAAPREGGWQQGRWLFISQPVLDQGEQQGRVVLVYDLARVRSRLRTGLLIAVVVAGAAMAIAYLVGRRVLRGLAAPIRELARVAVEVSETHDYSLRARRHSADELGQLTGAFNEMLSRIEEQGRELQRSNEERGRLLESERAARTEAERASRMKDEFVATLSHELRTPLTPIMGWTAVLRRIGGGDAQLREGLDVIERNARLQTQMIDDLLDMNRIASGKISLDVQRVDVVEVVAAALDTVRPAADARGIQLQPVLDPAAGAVWGDPDRLQQVVWNLLSNAIKFTEKNGRVQVALRRVDSHLEIVVSDTGIGIPEEFLPHVFDRFRQLDSSMSRRHGGLGLGLSIVRQLVELHGGSVRAESAGEGKGSTFTVSLPLMVAQARPQEEAPTIRDDSGSGLASSSEQDLPSLDRLSVLVVDDVRDARDLLSLILEQAGAAVTLAESADEAIEKLPEVRPDVLVSDIGMPGADGYELIRRVRGLPADAGARTPAIALTAFARTEDRTRALRAGYQLHIAKPVEPAELVTAVASLANSASSR